jgi:hypothetical protein
LVDIQFNEKKQKEERAILVSRLGPAVAIFQPQE